MTGIDRVEFAYLSWLLEQSPPLFALVRSAAGFLVLDRTGCRAFRDLVECQGPLPPADLLSRLTNRRDPQRACAETAVRGFATGRATRLGLRRMLAGLPRGFGYYNVGHANLDRRTLAAIKAVGAMATVMIHDTIPLDHPAFARPDTVAAFRRKLKAVSAHADRIVHLSHTTQATTEAQLARLGRVPQGVVGPLGVERPKPDPALLPDPALRSVPYFVTLGTIEPRKNHALLLDVWDHLPAPRPRLYIIGNRGWASPDLLHRLDSLPPDGTIRVLCGLPDGAVAALLQGARALLAPSRAEGFGLPPVEAALLGTPVIAADLAVTRELLGNKAVYLSPDDIYSWVETVVRQNGPAAFAPSTEEPPIRLTWADHFNAALRDG